MNRSASGPTSDAERAPRRARAGLVAFGVLVASAAVPVALSAMAATDPGRFAGDHVAALAEEVNPVVETSDPPASPPEQPADLVGSSNRVPCTAGGGAHCLAIVNQSDSRIQSWELRVLNPETNLFDHVRCLVVPGDNGSGTTFFPDVHLNEGQQFLLESRRDFKDCSGDMWAGQGYTMGGSDDDNYSFAGFSMSNPNWP
jgi:hypothetical protein